MSNLNIYKSKSSTDLSSTETTPLEDGAVYFTNDTHEIYADLNGAREAYGSGGGGSALDKQQIEKNKQDILAKVSSNGGDVSDTVINTIEEETTQKFPIISPKDTIKKAIGKLKKWQTDMVADMGNYVLKSMIANQQINDQNKVPSSALVYVMNQQISKLNEEVAPLLYENAGAHNSIYRGKNLGSSVTSVQYAAISSGKFTDLYIGDYWIINGVTWRIAAFDYWMNCGDTATTKHHVVVVPDNNLYTHKMNDTNVTTGGYVGSKMYKEGLTQAKNTIKSAFSGHVLSHRVYLTNTVANGRPSAGAWFNSEVDLMTEAMVYGTNVFSPVSDGTNIPANYNVDYKQLPLFALAPQFICNRNWYWLQNVVSAASFADVSYDGGANCGGASGVNGVRPAFAIS